MKNFMLAVPVFVLVIFVSSCKESKVPEGFEVVWSDANIYFVFLHENLLGDKTMQRSASTTICERDEQDVCEVYMWSKRDSIPKGLPIRNDQSFIHSYFKIDSEGKKHYKCLECE